MDNLGRFWHVITWKRLCEMARTAPGKPLFKVLIVEDLYHKPKGVAMRVLNVAPIRNTQVIVMDEPGAGNACHKYEIHDIKGPEEPTNLLGIISFQNGPIKESGINGVTNEDLLRVVIDRLQGFQSGSFNCRENQLALDSIQSGLNWLTSRTRQREIRGVEGTNVI
jgi:hypothetical protein